ncbi:MAG: methyltransferase domain-containing protein [Armatimonadia bacterium]|nr:methyltransferase domain-containing protein [Armatimonadia bacterium]
MATYYHRAAHVPEVDLRPPDPSCPICGHTERIPRYELQSEPEVLLLGCPRCHVASASRMPTEEALDRLYGCYYAGDPNPGGSCTFDDPERLGRAIAREYSPRVDRDPSLRVLDFGGGDGTIAAKVVQALAHAYPGGGEVTLVDASGTPPTDAEGVRFSVHRTIADAPEREFDLVIASAVLEHIPYPRPVLLSLLEALGGGGLFYARTPFMLPLARCMPTRRIGRELLCYPYHVHDMGDRFWDGVLEVLGMAGEYHVRRSRPSIVEQTMRRHPVRAAAARLLKAGRRLFGPHYRLVGGWEVFVERDHGEMPAGGDRR